MCCGRELGHIGAELGQQGQRCGPVHAWDRVQAMQQLVIRSRQVLDARIETTSVFLETIELAQ